MRVILQKLGSIGRLSGKPAEVVKEEYLKFFDAVDQKFSSFNPSQDRVGTLFPTTMGSSKLCTNLWDFVKNVFDPVSWSIRNRKRLQHQKPIAC